MQPDAIAHGIKVNEAAREAYNYLAELLQDDHLVSCAIIVMASHEVLGKGNSVNLTCTVVSDKDTF